LKSCCAAVFLRLLNRRFTVNSNNWIVSSDVWLTCRKKLMNNMKIQFARIVTHTWLAGKLKCGNADTLS